MHCSIMLIAVVFFFAFFAIVNCEETPPNAASLKLLAACLGPDEDVSVVQAMLKDEEVNINIKDPASGQTPLMASALRGKASFVEVLLQYGADATISEKDGYTPSHGAAFQGRVGVMKVLARNGLARQEFHTDGYLPFHRACWGSAERHVDLVRYMLESGLVHDVDVESKNGLTCLEMTRNLETIKVLNEFSRSNEL